MQPSNGSHQTSEVDGTGSSSGWRLSIPSQRRLLGSPYSYSLSPPWTRQQPLPPSTSPETTYTTSSPSPSTSPWPSNNRPLLNPLNNPLNQPVSRFSIDATTVVTAPQPVQTSLSGYTSVPLDQGDLGIPSIPPNHDTAGGRQWWRYIPWLILDILIAIVVVCLASMLSLLIGHFILRVASHSSSSPQDLPRGPFDAPIVPTIQAGVIGGAVLSLPFAFLVKVLFPPKDPPPPPAYLSEYDDFVSFEDNNGRQPQQRARSSTVTYNRGGVRETTLTRYQLHKIFVIVFCECVGVAGGPIGVLLLRECYSGKAGWDDHADVRLLDPKHAAESGAVGGAIVGPGVLLILWMGWKIWTDFFSREVDSRDRISHS